MPEHPRRKHWDGDDVGPLLGQQRDRLAERHLGGLPLAELREAEKDLLDRQIENQEFDALRAQLAHVIVGVDRKAERKSHRDSMHLPARCPISVSQTARRSRFQDPSPWPSSEPRSAPAWRAPRSPAR